MSLLVIPVILGLFVYTWTVDEKYSRRNSERIYGNQFKWNYLTNNTFSQFFAPFQKSRSIFKHFRQNVYPHSLCICESTDFKRRG